MNLTYAIHLRSVSGCLRGCLRACLLALVAACASAGAAPSAAPYATLALAEQPLRLIRGAAVYKAPHGIAVQKDDILETGSAGAQVEVGAGPDAIVALGPDTRVLVVAMDGASATGLALLQGWVKVLAAAGRGAVVVTPALQVTVSAGSAIVHSQDGHDAVFAEDGAQQVARIDQQGRAGAPLKLAAEQYAAVDPARPQLTPGRPPRAFVAAMPPGFRDRLVRARQAPGSAHNSAHNSANNSANKASPLKERDADFADVEAWLTSALPVRRGFVGRFRARLGDPAFRKPLERALGQSPEWKAVLKPRPKSDQSGEPT
jgi:hypothetical protein